MIKEYGIVKSMVLPLILAAVLGGLGSCSEDSEVVDIIPPPVPLASLISVSGPEGGLLTVNGQSGSVEGGARVEADNINDQSNGPASASAANNGAFSLQMAGAYRDSLSISAIDEAGNRSNSVIVIAGAPFSLVLGDPSGDGQSATVGSVLPDSVAFRVQDCDGLGMAGIEIDFDVSGGEAVFSPAGVVSDASGCVASRMTLGTVAGELTVVPSSTDLDFAGIATLTVTALPGPPDTLIWVAGDGQKDGPGETLLHPLVIRAEDSYGNGIPGLLIEFATQDGSVAPVEGDTDEDGRLATYWTLDDVLGEKLLSASYDTGSLTAEDARAEVDDPPTILGVNPTLPVHPGEPIFIVGTNFCEVKDYNNVTLGGVAMSIASASETQITATVPSLPEGGHALAIMVGHQPATPTSFVVEVYASLGEVEDHPFVGGEVSVDFVVPSASTRYVVIPYSLKRSGNYDVSTGTAESMTYGVETAAFPRGAFLADRAEPDPIRDLQRRLLTPTPPRPGDLPAEQGAVDRSSERRIGDRDAFYCLHNPYGSTGDINNYTSVTAALSYTGSNVLIYVDINSPTTAWAAGLEELGDQFDDTDYGIDVAAFGEPTDIDTNGKIIVLLSPIVNAMTDYLPPGAYIGGFFNMIDLDLFGSHAAPSNAAEIFYGIVPDPTAQFSGVAHQIDATIDALKAILVHEFQHMINAGQRHHPDFSDEPSSNMEHLWLNEGLSHLAESLAGYSDQNQARVELYLHSGHHAGTALAMDDSWSRYQGNSLAERGASYLMCRYLEDRWPGITLDLVGAHEAGTANVAAAVGVYFDQIFKDWIAAIYLDDRDLDGDGNPDDLGEAYRFESHNIRVDFPYSNQDEPLAIQALPFSDPSYSSMVSLCSMDYLHLVVQGSVPPGGAASIRFTGESDGEMGVIVVRVDQ